MVLQVEGKVLVVGVCTDSALCMCSIMRALLVIENSKMSANLPR